MTTEMSIERHEGKVHDRITINDADDEHYVGDITVLAGEDESDTVSLLAHGELVCADFRLAPAQAIRLGRILVAAGEDTLSRQRPAKDTGTEEG